MTLSTSGLRMMLANTSSRICWSQRVHILPSGTSHNPLCTFAWGHSVVFDALPYLHQAASANTLELPSLGILGQCVMHLSWMFSGRVDKHSCKTRPPVKVTINITSLVQVRLFILHIQICLQELPWNFTFVKYSNISNVVQDLVQTYKIWQHIDCIMTIHCLKVLTQVEVLVLLYIMVFPQILPVISSLYSVKRNTCFTSTCDWINNNDITGGGGGGGGNCSKHGL